MHEEEISTIVNSFQVESFFLRPDSEKNIFKFFIHLNSPWPQNNLSFCCQMFSTASLIYYLIFIS